MNPSILIFSPGPTITYHPPNILKPHIIFNPHSLYLCFILTPPIKSTCTLPFTWPLLDLLHLIWQLSLHITTLTPQWLKPWRGCEMGSFGTLPFATCCASVSSHPHENYRLLLVRRVKNNKTTSLLITKTICCFQFKATHPQFLCNKLIYPTHTW